MPEVGGPSNIAGVDFELWFTAYKLLDAFFDENVCVTPQAKTFEDPQTNDTQIIAVDDVYVHSDSKQEFFNLKFRSPNIINWTFSDLKKQKVLKQLKEQFLKTPNANIYFVSQTPCKLISEVLKRGGDM